MAVRRRWSIGMPVVSIMRVSTPAARSVTDNLDDGGGRRAPRAVASRRRSRVRGAGRALSGELHAARADVGARRRGRRRGRPEDVAGRDRIAAAVRAALEATDLAVRDYPQSREK